MTKDQERQLAYKLEYFEKWLDEYLASKPKKFLVEKTKIREALMVAYLRGRGDKV